MKKLQCGVILSLAVWSIPVRAGNPQEPASGQANASPVNLANVVMSGTVEVKNGKYFLSNVQTHRTVELRGQSLKQYLGKHVSVTGRELLGATPPRGVSSVVEVSRIVVAGASTTPAAAAATTNGVSTVTLTAIGVSAAVAGTLGGLYASGSLSDDQPASRP